MTEAPKRTAELWPLAGSSQPKLFPEFGVFVSEPVGEELLQTGIFFFKLHQILELIALFCVPGSFLPLIVGLFRDSGFLDCGPDALSLSDLLFDRA
ncbi:hypothetical protein MAXJ12_35981 [Mesorhizobium alhagi CCNWXJ12-2]|uniref:Uncharacterized protein n=1 Tax=Mesorhizobium alhagi CCNWXJ12-2 TaxID=1107882 RepID=H0I3X9_9HYPH|nr:hypothetical protein MAXJ12_35981 [Mesorhizobium alhagi CCNWXJ12-2]